MIKSFIDLFGYIHSQLIEYRSAELFTGTITIQGSDLTCWQMTDSSSMHIQLVYTNKVQYREYPVDIWTRCRCLRFSLEKIHQEQHQPSTQMFLRLVLPYECPRYTMSRKFINKWINDGEGMIKYCQEYSLGKDVLDIHKGECKSRRINQRYHAGEQIPNCQCDLMCITFQDCCDDAILGPQLDSLGIGFNTSFALELFEAVQCISNEYSHKDKRHNLGFYMVADCPSKSSLIPSN